MPDRELQYGPREDLLRLEEIVEICAQFARWGVERVRLTGGEPTLRRGIVDLVGALSQLTTSTGAPLSVVMTTNGDRLGELARPLRDAGLSGVTVSLDSLRPDRLRAITRRGDVDRVLRGIEAARAAGFERIKINTVAIRGCNDDELAEIAIFAWERGIVPRFIEIMPMAGGELYVPGEMMSSGEVRDTVAAELGADLVRDDVVRDGRGRPVAGMGPARYWRLVGGAHHGACFGTIGAMTENFCATCNRLRLSATGQLHGCLARDETGDLRAAVRSSDPALLEAVVRQVLGAKREGHGFELDGGGGPAKAMIAIGG